MIGDTVRWNTPLPRTDGVTAKILGSVPPSPPNHEGGYADGVVSAPQTTITPGAVGMRLSPGTKVGGGDLKLSRELRLTVEYGSDGVVIREGDIGEDGYGRTWALALDDCLSSLADRLHSLENRSERLSELDTATLGKLRQLLEAI